jgi:hypothetical protein
MLTNAGLTAATDDTAERAEEAQRQIHLAMCASVLGRITEGERQRILAILRPCCPDIFFTHPPIDEHPSLPHFFPDDVRRPYGFLPRHHAPPPNDDGTRTL